jgi:hypothetical protein
VKDFDRVWLTAFKVFVLVKGWELARQIVLAWSEYRLESAAMDGFERALADKTRNTWAGA